MLRIKSPYPFFNRLAETKKISALWKRQNYTSHVNPFLHSRNPWFNRRRRENLKGDSNQPPESCSLPCSHLGWRAPQVWGLGLASDSSLAHFQQSYDPGPADKCTVLNNEQSRILRWVKRTEDRIDNRTVHELTKENTHIERDRQREIESFPMIKV